MMRPLLLVLALAAAPVLAQQQPPPQKPEAEAAKERRPLNLQLDNPSSFATTAPAEKDAEKNLPTLGGDARRFAPPKREGSGPTPGGPFPKDTNPQN